MVGTTYTVQPMPPDEASTDWFEAPPLRIGIEYRRVDPEALADTYGDDAADMAEIEANSPEGGFTDEGVSIHVVEVGTGHEYLRFDVFVDEPHYHYVDRDQGTNNVVEFDEVAHGPMMPWMLDRLRTRLPEMLVQAGATELAAAMTDDLMATVAERVQTRLKVIGEGT